jgi:hypothetical protein
MRQFPTALACASLLILTACQVQPGLSPNPTLAPAVSGLIPSALVLPPKLKAEARVSAKPSTPQHTDLSFQIGYRELGAAFKTQALDCGSVMFAKIQVSGLGLPTPLYATGSDSQQMIAAGGSCQLTAQIANVPYGLDRVFSVTLYDNQRQVIGGGTLKSVSDIEQATVTIELTQRQNVTARVIEGLLAQGTSGEFLASQLNLPALQAYVDTLIGVTGLFPYTFTTDPSLIRVDALIAALQASNGAVSQLGAPATFIAAPQILPLTLAGFIPGQALSASLDDPLSTVVPINANGSFNLTNVPPGTWNLTLSGPGYVTQRIPVTVNADGSTTIAPVTVLPPAPTFSNYSAGPTFAGGSLTITGTGFNTTQLGNNQVLIGGQLATVISATATSLTVTVPAGLGGNQAVSLQIGALTTPLGNLVLAIPVLSSMSISSGIVGTPVDLAVSPISSTVGDNAVRFGTTQATTVTAISGGLRALVPAGAWGQVPVSVQPLSSARSNELSFTVVPAIAGTTAASGSVGSAFVIKGTGFGPLIADNTVRINGAIVPIASVDATGLHVVLPAGLYGSVPVTVQTTGSPVSSVFSLALTPVIDTLAVGTGSQGDVLTLTGSGFHPTAGSNTVTLGATALTPTNVSTTGMQITLPNLRAGVYALTIGVGAQTSVAQNVTLKPKVTAVTTAENLAGKPLLIGGATITISGTNFDLTAAGNNTVNFGATAVVASGLSGSDLQVVVPRTLSAGDLNLTTTVNGQASAAMVVNVPVINVNFNGGFN